MRRDHSRYLYVRRLILIRLTFLLLLLSTQAFAACSTGYFPGSETETTRKYIFCDTAAELPTSGMSTGDLLSAGDTGKFYVATSDTAYGASGSKSTADDQIPISDGVASHAWKAVNDCQGTGKALTYTAATNSVGCNTISGSGAAWGDITGTLSAQTDLQTALDAKQALDADLTDLADGTLTASKVQAFPIGAVFISVVSTDPATLLGYGTWSAIGAGKMLVGLDSGDTDFDTAEETGGAKTKTIAQANLPNISTGAGTAHTHVQDTHNHVITELRDATTGGSTTNIALTADTSSTTGTKTTGSRVATNQDEAAHTHSLGGSGTALNVVNPYLTVYIWKRTA